MTRRAARKPEVHIYIGLKLIQDLSAGDAIRLPGVPEAFAAGDTRMDTFANPFAKGRWPGE